MSASPEVEGAGRLISFGRGVEKLYSGAESCRGAVGGAQAKEPQMMIAERHIMLILGLWSLWGALKS